MPNSSKKNIIICADGTGNKGGYTPDSNVYKTYNGVELHNAAQISFYDNGVGTSTNKLWRMLSGALGFGFQRNVRDLYRFLAMHYAPGDDVYLFGFSRGAATVRAFLGFISTCGLVNGRKLSYEKLEEYTKDAFCAYRDSKYNEQRAIDFREHKNSHGVIPIHFVGVWDTVAALGLPTWFDKIGFVSRFFAAILTTVDKILNLIWKHHFYKYDLSDNILNAYQALALDDARTSFWPMVWDETDFIGEVEQVWFAGMHSNVGGGYERTGMANVALHWMLVRAAAKGLKFKPGFVEAQMEDANVNGRLYDSRDGFAIVYRFHPRDIEQLCAGKLAGPIRIHASVFERMRRKTANYAPLHMPREFQLGHSDMTRPGEVYSFTDDTSWAQAAARVGRYILLRKSNYMGMVILLLGLLYLTICTWTGHVDYWGRSGLGGHVADVADYLTPFMFENLVELSIMRYPLYAVIAILGLWAFWRYNQGLRRKTLQWTIVIRELITAKVK